MKLIILSILLGVFHLADPGEAATRNHPAISASDTTLLQPDSTLTVKEKVKESVWYKQLEDSGKSRALISVLVFIGGIVLLRFSARLLRKTDNLLLRVQHRPNAFDGFRFTGNPFILKKPFYALYHLFLGKNAYLSYLVWPLKYSIAISLIAAFVIRGIPDESMNTIQHFQAFLLNSLSAQIACGLVLLLYLAVLVLLVIESIRKSKWLFPLRLLIFLVMASVIFALMYKLFWFVVGIAIVYQLTHLGRDFINRQKNAAAQGYPAEDFIYEPWPDASSKV